MNQTATAGAGTATGQRTDNAATGKLSKAEMCRQALTAGVPGTLGAVKEWITVRWGQTEADRIGHTDLQNAKKTLTGATASTTGEATPMPAGTAKRRGPRPGSRRPAKTTGPMPGPQLGSDQILDRDQLGQPFLSPPTVPNKASGAFVLYEGPADGFAAVIGQAMLARAGR